ncbi:MAG: MarR family winged helix-turn-helix transcriptional regulator [Thermaerobacter sp.]|nr:MarR family winged helix-turn-helix transcriptional regulator [Thermaerobacter sp.]
MPNEASTGVTKDQYEVLAAFRRELRAFLRFSEQAAARVGLTPQQHQLLLAIKGYPGREWATISELSEVLALRHHSVVGIVDRSCRAGIVQRRPHADDRRYIEVVLTATGEARLEALTKSHVDELRRLWPTLAALQRLH